MPTSKGGGDLRPAESWGRPEITDCIRRVSDGVSDGCQIAAEVQPDLAEDRHVDRRARPEGRSRTIAQQVAPDGVLNGPRSRETDENAATAVPTPSIGLAPEAID